MRKGKFLIMIDQATRDAVGQLLTGLTLQRQGHRVAYCNQMTLKALCERFQPNVLYSSWCSGGEMDAWFQNIRPRTRIALVDQEGRRSGETSFKRALRLNDNAQIRTAGLADKIVAWEGTQGRWIADEGIPKDRIAVVGSARLDPYLAFENGQRKRPNYLGITLRADSLTSDPLNILRNIYGYRAVNPGEGIRPALPVNAQYEDWIWEGMAITRVMLRVITEIRRSSKIPMLVRPGPWERYRMYDFLPKEIPDLKVAPFMLQHEYLRECFATIDCYSTLGIESLLAGTPVISIVHLVPRLEQHVGGAEGTRFNAPYRSFFWQPKDLAELIELVLKAQRGELPVSPDLNAFKQYMRDSYSWPGDRPASFKTAELLISLLDTPPRTATAGKGLSRESGIELFKRFFYRYVPGSAWVPTSKLLWRYFFGLNRDSIRRYHYLGAFYPHHKAVRRLFETLWQQYGPI